MSRLYGTLAGNRGEATRCGHKNLVTHAAGWRGAIRVTVSANDDGKDYFTVELVPWQNSGGRSHQLASGLLDANIEVTA